MTEYAALDDLMLGERNVEFLLDSLGDSEITLSLQNQVVYLGGLVRVLCGIDRRCSILREGAVSPVVDIYVELLQYFVSEGVLQVMHQVIVDAARGRLVPEDGVILLLQSVVEL